MEDARKLRNFRVQPPHRKTPYRLTDGRTASISMAPSHDQEIEWNSLTDYLEACRVLGIESDARRAAQATLDRLALSQIAPDGRLTEWPENYAETEPGHRHLSHLWGDDAWLTVAPTHSFPCTFEPTANGVDFGHRIFSRFKDKKFELPNVALPWARLHCRSLPMRKTECCLRVTYEPPVRPNQSGCCGPA